MGLGFVDIFLMMLVVAGPTKALAFYASKAGSLSMAERRATALKSVITATIILLVFALFGSAIIGFFHVSVPALEIAGGAILFVFALQIVLGEGGHDDTHGGGESFAIYPMAMPLMASPQAIVAIVVMLARIQGPADRINIILAILVTMAINLGTFWIFANRLGTGEAKKPTGASDVILRVVAILLAGLAVQLMILGFRDLGVLPPAPAH